jgi:tRNA1Val (adenine37-N6)-methyltransferase
MKVGTDAILLSALLPDIEPQNILEIGTGCGIVALCMAQRYQQAVITAIDIDRESIDEAAASFANSKFRQRLTAIQTSLQNFAKTPLQNFDLIVSNPPFFENSLLSDKINRNISRHNINLTLEDLALCSSTLLSSNGTLALILPNKETTKFLLISAQHNLFCTTQYLIADKQSKPCKRIVSLFKTTKPTSHIAQTHIILRKEDNTMTKAYKDLTSAYLL